ncbi:MAG: Dps family protein [Bdellovibrionales bacterium]
MPMQISLEEARQLSPLGITPKAGEQMISTLNRVLADEFILFTKTLNFHWNIRGPQFASLHALLDSQYHEILEIMDSIAERVKMARGFPVATVGHIQEESSLTEGSSGHSKHLKTLLELVRDHLSIEAEITGALEGNVFDADPGTEDFITGVLKRHQKITWMLQSHLEL